MYRLLPTKRLKQMEFDVFGRRIIVERHGAAWLAFEPGNDGKRRAAEGIVIPADLPEEGIAQFLADLCHEDASPSRPHVRRLR